MPKNATSPDGRSGSYTEAVVLSPLSPDGKAVTDPTVIDDDELIRQGADANKYSPPQFRRYATDLPPVTPPPSHNTPVDLPTPNFQQDVKHSVIIVRTPVESEGACPYSGCDGCKEPLECGYRRQYDRSLLLAYLREGPDGLIRPDLLDGDKGKHEALVAEAQKWGRDTSTGKDGIVIHKVVSFDTLQGIAIMYGTTVAAIRKENKMISSEVMSYRTLRIPSANEVGGQMWSPSPGPRALATIVKTAMIELLQKKTRVTFDEARVLLDLNDNNIEAAMAENEAWMKEEERLRGNAPTGKKTKGAKSTSPGPATLQEFLYLQANKA